MEKTVKVSKPFMDDLKHTVFLWRKSRLTMIGSAIILIFLLMAAFAPLIAPFDPVQQNLQNKLQAPSWQHLFGTDQFGRDIFSRVIIGSRIALWIIFLVSVISGSIGIIVGVTAGYFGGIVDEVLMRITDMFLAFPSLVLAMAFAAMLGPNLTNTIIAISVVTWTTYARLSRAEATKVKSQPYIEAIRAAGGGNLRIMFLHVLPMCISPVLVQLTLRMGTIILTAASLGFLGLGVQPPTPEWGAMVSDGRNYLIDQWWISTFPGIFIAFVVLGFNLLGDGIRDMLDPRLRR
ncbi:D-ala-D-ala transporter subunit [Mesotoga sp. Brook.08.YT.4.2.5.1]|jgi:peptide/nickel transport system permease protein|uniref:nickel transporter permease n=2 Tax=Mesotoga TaxID=1184396 RepID=UPI000AE2D423|nr:MULTISPECIES: nickel transporter permease [unclassified Mesotoga]MDD3460546.1 ABC transporter permease [Mesotoga sp.]PNE23683.1 D-ala-D-ala transporter subunit [Mesotoga sp. Brook.08.YT.4.2.5.1]PVD15440.1 cytochrome C550 [Mesotoga sp. Brook.08.105.5.1]RAO97242.1 cytochrome C550 [Mesotoga sp. Brook.08.YT.4.2.5.4.]RDI91549.1 D-ala-D-ala transporter subunit [Mesotoga sp. Brook.08.YT.4.2.5.2.]